MGDAWEPWKVDLRRAHAGGGGGSASSKDKRPTVHHGERPWQIWVGMRFRFPHRANVCLVALTKSSYFLRKNTCNADTGDSLQAPSPSCFLSTVQGGLGGGTRAGSGPWEYVVPARVCPPRACDSSCVSILDAAVSWKANVSPQPLFTWTCMHVHLCRCTHVLTRVHTDATHTCTIF